MRLQTAKHGKNEEHQEFADRCRELAYNVMRWDSDPAVQETHKEYSETMLLASFVAGQTGEVGKLTIAQNPQNLDQALNSALAVREVVRQEMVMGTFYTKFEKSVRISDRGGKGESDARRYPKHAGKHRNEKK
jgi:hypothetical protein